MSAYYNEIDSYCAAWLKNLMDAGHIPQGVIDTRSIEDVRPDELAGFTQCHFFAGLGGWAYALQLAGWGARPVWTGSCPCQPFSAAGKGNGFADQRHLWPAWQHLIAQRRPPVIFGEQVASKTADHWIDLVHADVEGMDYAFGCVPFPAAGIGAPHIRDRNYWVADADSERLDGQQIRLQQRAARFDHAKASRSSGSGRLDDADGRHPSAERQQRGGEQRQQPQDGGAGGMARLHSDGCKTRSEGLQAMGHGSPTGADCGDDMRLPSPLHDFWRAADWLHCTDGRWRPVEPGTFPLAHGLPAGMGKLSPELLRLAEVAGLDAASLRRAKGYRIECLKGYGNAIVPQQAALFVREYMECAGIIPARKAVAA